MSATLIWITPAAEETIGYCARVSSPQNQGKDASRLLRYCIRHGHWSVFEMASACFEIQTTRAISAQIIRHRSFSFQEFSQRYATVDTPPEFPAMRHAGATNRQSSIEAPLTPQQDAIVASARTLTRLAHQSYKRMIEAGIASECARAVLPMCSPTRLYMAGTIRSWIHYTNLRKKNDTQEEHRQIAENIHAILSDHLPTIMAALSEKGTE